MSNEVEIIPPKTPDKLAARDPEALLKFAVEHGASVDVCERLMAVRRELRAEQAKTAFDDSLAAFQSECPVIVKSKAGAKNAYKYAPLDSIVNQVRDLLHKHGFNYSVTTEV